MFPAYDPKREMPCSRCESLCRGMLCESCLRKVVRGLCGVCNVKVPVTTIFCDEHKSRCLDCKTPNTPGKKRCRPCADAARRGATRHCVDCSKVLSRTGLQRCRACHMVYMRKCRFHDVPVLKIKHAKEKALA